MLQLPHIEWEEWHGKEKILGKNFVKPSDIYFQDNGIAKYVNPEILVNKIPGVIEATVNFASENVILQDALEVVSLLQADFGLTSLNDIIEYKGCLVFAQESTVREHLEEDEFLIDELVGLNVYDGEERVGSVVGVSNNGASDLLSVKTNSKNICLIPFVKAIVLSVDIKNNKKSQKIYLNFWNFEKNSQYRVLTSIMLCDILMVWYVR